jgi:hypothetical protein
LSTVLDPLQEAEYSAKAAPETIGAVTKVFSGVYERVDEGDIGRYLPEGLPYGVAEEFDFSMVKSWMKRDVGKLLCNVVNEFERRKGTSLGGDVEAANAIEFDVDEVPGLTNHAEDWEETKVGVRMFGKSLPGMDAFTHDYVGVVDSLKGMDGELPHKIMLAGPRGSGKSVALAQMVMHARSRGWLCVYVPRAWSQMMDGDYVEPLAQSSKDVVLGSGDVSRLFNNPTLSCEILRTTLQAHGTDLAALPLTNATYKAEAGAILKATKEEWDRSQKLVSSKRVMSFLQKRRRYEDEDHRPEEDDKDEAVLSDFDFDSFGTPQTVQDLCLLGLAFRDFSGFAVSGLLHELRGLKDPTKPVLLAVDEYNCLIGASAFYFDNAAVSSEELCVPRALRFFSKSKATTNAWTMANGLCVGAISHKYHEGRFTTFSSEVKSVPLLIDVPRYTVGEYLSAIQHYVDNICIPPEVKAQRMVAFRTYTASNPGDVRLGAGPFFNRDALEIVGNPGEMSYAGGEGEIYPDTFAEEGAGGGGKGRSSSNDDDQGY